MSVKPRMVPIRNIEMDYWNFSIDEQYDNRQNSLKTEMVDEINEIAEDNYETFKKKLKVDGTKLIDFDADRDITFIDEALAYHPNAMKIVAYDKHEYEVYANTYYSIGGGFVLDESHVNHGSFIEDNTQIPYPFQTAKELLALCKKYNCSISHLMLENEKSWRTEDEIRTKIIEIWQAMQTCIQSGLEHEGVLELSLIHI